MPTRKPQTKLKEDSSYEDADSPWKEILERFFPDFLSFFFPQAHADIDWSRPYEFLDKELQKVVREANLGRRTVDKLVKVWLINGLEVWVLIHIEVQGQQDETFPKRMYMYNYRLFDRYGKPVASFAILADDNPDWRPDSFQNKLWGSEAGLRFPAVKLLDYQPRLKELEANPNPFALVVMAHLKSKTTKSHPTNRFKGKIELVESLYKRGYSRESVLELLRFIDWLLVLPDDLELKFDEAVDKLEEEKRMLYVTSWERRALKKGREEGRQRGEVKAMRKSVLEVLETRNFTIPITISERIQHIDDTATLSTLHKEAIRADSIEQFEAALPVEKRKELN